ncbi:MAG: hypothetical protein AAFU68_02875 [Pseudomonadota bacterium]
MTWWGQQSLSKHTTRAQELLAEAFDADKANDETAFNDIMRRVDFHNEQIAGADDLLSWGLNAVVAAVLLFVTLQLLRAAAFWILAPFGKAQSED